MYNKTVLFIFMLGTLPIYSMELSDQVGKSPKKSKRDRIIDTVRAIPSSLFSNKKTIVLDAVNTFFSLQDLVGKMVQQIYVESSFYQKCKNVRKFSGVNKTVYYFCEKYGYTDKGIIRELAISYNLSDLDLAIVFQHQEIEKKIRNLFDKAESSDQSFTQKDLKDKWFLESTRTSNAESFLYPEQETLVMVTIKKFDRKKTKALLKAGVSHYLIDPVVLMIVPRINSFNYQELNESEQEKFISIIHVLFGNGVHPDSRYMVTIPTLLHLAAFNHDRALAHLLLKKYNADPYRLYIECDPDDSQDVANLKQLLEKNSTDELYFGVDDQFQSCKHNAFTLEVGEPKGWLKEMYDEISRKKNKSDR